MIDKLLAVNDLMGVARITLNQGVPYTLDRGIGLSTGSISVSESIDTPVSYNLSIYSLNGYLLNLISVELSESTPIDWVISYTLNSSDNITITLNCLPEVLGLFVNTLQITLSDDLILEVPVTIEVLPKDVLVVSGLLDFGEVSVGSFKTLPLTIYNSGNSSLTLYYASVSTTSISEYSILGNGVITIASGETYILDVTFTPKDSSLRLTSLILSDVIGDHVISLRGIGLDSNGLYSQDIAVVQPDTFITNAHIPNGLKVVLSYTNNLTSNMIVTGYHTDYVNYLNYPETIIGSVIPMGGNIGLFASYTEGLFVSLTCVI